jgi:DNA-binding response OmpR family regulator
VDVLTETQGIERSGSMSQYRILLVEDAPDQALLLKRWLETGMAGEVTVAKDAASGVVLARKQEFDLILSDIELPFGSGFDIVRWSKTEQPRRPVVLMTAKPLVEYAISGLRVHADEYLLKPLDRSLICEILVVLIEKYRSAS